MPKDRMKVYMVNIAEFMRRMEEDSGERLVCGVEEHRQEKWKKITGKRAQAECLAAGLLLKRALRDFLTDRAKGQYALASEEVISPEYVDVRTLLEDSADAFPFRVLYGANGKPYIEDVPVCFNLSHSGDFALCAVCSEEVGVDIQQMRFRGEGDEAEKALKTAKRFFSEKELKELENSAEKNELIKVFFSVWVHKEALGKLTGRGLQDIRDMAAVEKQAVFREILVPDGYAAVVCVYKSKLELQE